MTRDELLQRISNDANICSGKPCIKGQRIWVWLVLDLLASSWTFQQVLDSYPGISEEDIRACIAYGAEMTRERHQERRNRTLMKYKGYSGQVTTVDEGQRLIHGHVVGIRDVITFEAKTVDELIQAFHDSVDDYLDFCRERGEAPQKPVCGST